MSSVVIHMIQSCTAMLALQLNPEDEDESQDLLTGTFSAHNTVVSDGVKCVVSLSVEITEVSSQEGEADVDGA